MRSRTKALRDCRTFTGWSFVGDPPHWEILIDVLPAYPIPVLDPGDHVRMPVAITMGGPAAVEIILRAQTEAGEREL